MLITANNSNEFTIIKNGIHNHNFSGNPTIQTGDSRTHLGIAIERDRINKRTTLSKSYYIKKNCDLFDNNNQIEKMPYKTNILKSNPNSPTILPNKYLLLLMSTFVVARMTR